MQSRDRDAQFGWGVMRLAPPPDEGDHVGGMQIQRLIYDATMAYLIDVAGVANLEALGELSARPTLRGVSAEFETELFGGAPIVISVRTAMRSRRSFVLEALVCLEGDGRVIARGRTSFVVVDPGAWRATDIPVALLAAMEGRDGRPAPFESRT